MKIAPPPAVSKPRQWVAPVLLALILAGLFWRSFLPDYVHFSNDSPLGQQNTQWAQVPAAFLGTWTDLNVAGSNGGAFTTSDVAVLFKWLVGPVGYAKFLAPAALLLVGLSAWFFFRQLRLSPLAAALGALAAMLNSTFLSDACWGIAQHEIALAMDFFALALVAANTRETPWINYLVRLALAGLCVGINVVEGGDVGALYSIFIAAFVFFKAVTDEGGTIFKKIAGGMGCVAVVAMFAGFIAMQQIALIVRPADSRHRRHSPGCQDEGGALGLCHSMEPAENRNHWPARARRVWLQNGYTAEHDACFSRLLRKWQLLGRHGT